MPLAKNMTKLEKKHGRISVKIFISLLSALMVFFSASHSSFGQNDNQGANNTDGAQVTLNLQDIDILVLINLVAENSGKNFIVDPRVRGKVSVVSGASLNADELYDVFLSILEVHNFAAVETGNVIKVLPSNVIKQRPTPTMFEPTIESNDAQITQIIQLEHASVQDLVAIIRPLIPATSHFAPHVPSNSVIITDTTANIQRVLEIIKRIDIPDQRANVRVVYLTKAKASELAGTLTQIITSTIDPKDAASGSKVSIQPVDAINALIISSPDSEYAKIQALIDELDIERELQDNINVIYLKHAKAEDLVTILNDVTSGQAVEGQVTEFSVQADEATNALIVKATGNQLKVVRNVIEKLDLQRAQVYVETVIAEVSLGKAAELGVNWGAGGAIDNSTSTTVGTGDDAVTTTTDSTIGNLVDRNNTNTVIGTAAVSTLFDLATGGLTYSLLDFGKYQLDAIINAIRSDTNSNILSTPTILTLNNEEAEIIVGQEVPFITGSFNNGTGNTTSTDEDGNTVTNVANSFQTIERKDVGIKLKIKPQINDGNTIQLEVFQEISSVSETTINGQSDIITDLRSLEAVVQADDGQVIVLGGLIEDNVVETVSSIPILGKIPIIGALFRSKSKSVGKTNLMVFLKPRIIRSAADLAKYSKTKYDEVRSDELQSRIASNNFLIEESEPPVLELYDNVQDEGKLRSEQRLENYEQFKTEAETGLEDKSKRTVIDLFKKRPPVNTQFETAGKIEDEENRIDWEDLPDQSDD